MAEKRIPKNTTTEKINQVVQKILGAKQVVLFTGAGISTESGIPDYRSQGGLWEKFKPIYFDDFMTQKKARIQRCLACKRLITWEEAMVMINAGARAPECTCGGYYKPDTISFGQAMPEKETQKVAMLSANSDVFIVVGSTLLVQPAALMPEYARNAGAFLVIINLSQTPFDSLCHVLIQDKAGKILEKITRGVERGLDRQI